MTRGMDDSQPIGRSERGASAVEYGLLIAGVATLIVAVVFLFGEFIGGLFSPTCDAINASMATASSDC